MMSEDTLNNTNATPGEGLNIPSPDSAPEAADAGNQPTPETSATAEAKPTAGAPATPIDATPIAISKDAFDGRLDERTDLVADDDPMTQPGMNWFVLRVASNKESYVRNTLIRKIQIEGLSNLVGRILVPTEKTKTIKGGKQRITETKLYPGYVFVEMRLEDDGRIPQDVFFLIKETTGVGDFVGPTGRPTPMAPHEIEKMILDSRKPDEMPVVRLVFESGDQVTIKEGPFEGYEGTVDELLPEKGIVRVLVTIFGRQAPIELEEWQIAKVEDG